MYIFVAKAIMRPRVKQNYNYKLQLQITLLEKYFDLFNHIYHLGKDSPIWVYG